MFTANVFKNEKSKNLDKLNEIKNKVDNFYLFLNLSEEKSTNLFQNTFNKMLNQDRFINSVFLDKLEEMYNLEYKKIIKDKILNDTSRKFLQNYVNYLLLNYENDSYEKLFSFAKELDSSLTYLSVDDYKFLINNTVLKDLIEDCIAKDEIDFLLDTSLYTLIILYYNLKDLDILKNLNKPKDGNFYEECIENDTFQADQLNAYINMIPSKILTAEEEKYYLKQVSLGNKEAKDYLIKHNLKLVINIAKKYQNRGLELADLIQEGNIGLIKAIDKFDINMETRLSTYATIFIHNAIRKAISNYGRTIRIPIYLKEKIVKVSKIKNNLNNTLGRQATNKEIAKELGITVKKVEDIIKVSKDVISYNVKIEESESNDELIDLVSDKNINIEEDFIKTNFQENILELLELLNEKERYILIHRFGLNNEEEKTLEQIGKDLNVKAERIRQIEKAALKKLANEQKVRNNVDYLDKIIDFSKEDKKLHIYDYFKDSKYLFSAFSYLEENEVNYLKNIYGEYFDKRAEVIDTDEFKELINKLNVIMEALKKPNNLIINYSSLNKILGTNSVEEALCLIEKLNINDQNILTRKYPDGINNLPKKLDYPLEIYFLKGIVKKMKLFKETKDNKILLKEKKN